MSDVSAALACQSSASAHRRLDLAITENQCVEPTCSPPRQRISSTATLSGARLPTWPLTISSRSKPLARTQLANSTTASITSRAGSENVPGHLVVCACDELTRSVGSSGTPVRAGAAADRLHDDSVGSRRQVTSMLLGRADRQDTQGLPGAPTTAATSGQVSSAIKQGHVIAVPSRVIAQPLRRTSGSAGAPKARLRCDTPTIPPTSAPSRPAASPAPGRVHELAVAVERLDRLLQRARKLRGAAGAQLFVGHRYMSSAIGSPGSSPARSRQGRHGDTQPRSGRGYSMRPPPGSRPVAPSTVCGPCAYGCSGRR